MNVDFICALLKENCFLLTKIGLNIQFENPEYTYCV